MTVGSGTRLVWRRMGRTLQLGVIGTMAGIFGGLFGVGGGIVIVPLLVLWLGYEEREATGTSLAAIVLIAVVAAALQAVYGNLHYGYGVAIGLPAVAGVVAGTWLQQRIPTRWITRGFALLLGGIAIGLLL